MKISVLTPAWNSVTTIRHTLDSFLTQDHAEKEMIVIDGASTDGTVDVVSEYREDGIRLVSEPDRGMYDALNKGLALYRGDAVGVLNSDDTYHGAHALSRIAEALERIEIVHGHLDFVTDHVSKLIRRGWRATSQPTTGFRTGWMPAHPTFYVSRSVVDAVGPFDLRLKTASDYDWMLRAVEVHGFRTSVVDAVLVDMMHGGKSTVSLRSHIEHNLEALSSRRRWLRTMFIDYAFFAKPLRKIGQFYPPKIK
ncbi:glycosyltransferase family 2 protein [Aurantimonas sp. A2-1-M11]|uniref:glycosyltransferase family 2 protein n=1 Tax=Aurantimonas sp. A2-1-M11 TaxID=3113712 RepID=UPI002F91C393